MTHACAFVFPGQGSQSIGMLADFARKSKLVTETFATASTELGYDLWQLVQHGEAAQLNATAVTQPALLTASVALWRLWQDRGGELPSALAGHSLGEYSALVCAGVLGFEDAVKLVAARGRYMQAAVPEGQGSMAAIIGLSDDAVNQVCAEIDGLVAAANYNTIGQVVIAGETEAVNQAMVAAKMAGAKMVKALAVSVPSHCQLMQSAAAQLARDIERIDFQSPKIPVVNNVNAQSPQAGSAIKTALIEQLCQPVQWVKTIQALATEQGIHRFIECGPGNVLTGLIKRQIKGAQLYTLSQESQWEEALSEKA